MLMDSLEEKRRENSARQYLIKNKMRAGTPLQKLRNKRSDSAKRGRPKSPVASLMNTQPKSLISVMSYISNKSAPPGLLGGTLPLSPEKSSNGMLR